MTRPHARRPWSVRLLAAAAVALVGSLLVALPAAAHNYAATVFATLTEPEPGVVRAQLDIEYVLLAIDGSAAMEVPEFAEAARAGILADGQNPAKLGTEVLEEFDETVVKSRAMMAALAAAARQQAPK